MVAGGSDYLDAVSKDAGGNKKKLSNLQVDQMGMEESPAEGGEGYVGGNPNASAVGFDYVTGKKGYSEDRPVWSTETESVKNEADSLMGSSPSPAIQKGGSDSTDENATYKKVETDEGLPQTHVSAEVEGDSEVSGDNQLNPNTQDIGEGQMSEMPQTEFSNTEGGGAPLFKRSK